MRRFSFEFQDTYADLTMPTMYLYLTPTNRLSNDWPMGTGLLLAPFVLLPLVFAHAWMVIIAMAAVIFWWRSAKFTAADKTIAILCTVCGTPLLFYLLYGPFFSHVPSFAATTVFIVYWSKTREGRSRNQAFVLGILLGLSALVRPQNLLLGVVFLSEIRRKSAWREFGFIAIGALIGFAPQMIGYWILYGSPVALPKVEEMQWTKPAIAETLFSDFHGIVPWTPLYVLLPAGMVSLWRRDRQLSAALSLLFLVQLYLNSANFVWWSGGSFGNRRLADSAIVISYAIAALASEANLRQRRIALTLATACCAWTLWLVLAERRGLVPLDRYVSFRTPAFWQSMLRVFTEPVATISALLGPLTNSIIWQRVVAATGIAVSFWILFQKPIFARFTLLKYFPQILAFGLILITGFAALRTGKTDDPELEKQLGRHSRMLWDNYIELSFYRIERKQYDDAVAVAEKAIALRPSHYSGWWYKAMAQYRAGQYLAAVEGFAKVQQLNPEHPRASQMREMAVEQSIRGFAPPVLSSR